MRGVSLIVLRKNISGRGEQANVKDPEMGLPLSVWEQQESQWVWEQRKQGEKPRGQSGPGWRQTQVGLAHPGSDSITHPSSHWRSQLWNSTPSSYPLNRIALSCSAKTCPCTRVAAVMDREGWAFLGVFFTTGATKWQQQQVNIRIDKLTMKSEQLDI